MTIAQLNEYIYNLEQLRQAMLKLGTNPEVDKTIEVSLKAAKTYLKCSSGRK